MTSNRAFQLVLAGVLCSTAPAAAQTPEQFQIKVQGSMVRSDGGEQPSVWMSSGALEIGKRTTSRIVRTSGTGCLHVAARLPSDADKGWSVEFTPTRVQGNAVTFHMRWTGLDSGKELAAVETDLTLRPGESIPIDSIPVVGSSAGNQSCRATAITLRARVDYWPPPEYETRLVATDLWLVEKSSDGTERTQPLTVRGLPNDSLAFHFAPLTEGKVSLDIYGELRAAPGQGEVELSLVTRSRIVEAGQSSTIWRTGALLASRKIESKIQLKPGEVVSVELPRLGENQSGAFASRTLSLRLRSQHLR
jgi:hypothetical protein